MKRLILLLAFLPCSKAEETLPVRTAGKYIVAMRVPPDGVFAQEETEVEFRIEDTSRVDPLTGNTPVVRARVDVSVLMPQMPGMPGLREQAHVEGVPGEYGVHPTFAHGGDYLVRLAITPPQDEPFQVEFPLAVLDASSARNRKSRPPRYYLELTSFPKSPKPGEPAELQLMVRERENPKIAVSEFDRTHQELLHLVVVRTDLTHFAHLHPVLGADGIFRISHTFDAAGEYHLFADTAPKGAGSQVLMATLKTAGKPDAAALPQPTNVQNVAGLRIEADAGAAGFRTRETIPVAFSIRDAATGQPASDLEPYLGAQAHLILIHQDAVTFVHAHADELSSEAGRLRFLARFPKLGVYKSWLQFKRQGQVVTAEFTFTARGE
jgi:hypothetical protein